MNELTDDAQANHDLFVQRVKETSEIWGLKSDTGWAVCESNEYEDTIVYPLWSDADSAQIHCADEWAGYAPIAIDLEIFLETWLPGMDEDEVLIGTNWDAELSGMEVEPVDLARQLGGAE